MLECLPGDGRSVVETKSEAGSHGQEGKSKSHAGAVTMAYYEGADRDTQLQLISDEKHLDP